MGKYVSFKHAKISGYAASVLDQLRVHFRDGLEIREGPSKFSDGMEFIQDL